MQIRLFCLWLMLVLVLKNNNVQTTRATVYKERNQLQSSQKIRKIGLFNFNRLWFYYSWRRQNIVPSSDWPPNPCMSVAVQKASANSTTNNIYCLLLVLIGWFTVTRQPHLQSCRGGLLLCCQQHTTKDNSKRIMNWIHHYKLRRNNNW